MRLSDLQSKDVINVTSGKKIGTIIDANVSNDGFIDEIIVDNGKFFSKFSSSETKINWVDVKKIGEDVILVYTDFIKHIE